MVRTKGLQSTLKLGFAGAWVLTLAACGAGSTGTNGAVSFGIQGTHPDSLSVLSEQAIGVLSRWSGGQ